MNNGSFIISLDFELMWGVRDKRTINSYGSSILAVSNVIDSMLKSFDVYNINVTFATVGFLFFDKVGLLLKNLPGSLPSYIDENLSPYSELSNLKNNDEIFKKYYSAARMLKKISNYKNHEIATHTYSHYYCLEKGQNIKQFELDIAKAIEVAQLNNINISSIVFPRNQFCFDYLKICEKYKIQNYRGNENHFIYESGNSSSQNILKRLMRFVDSYINLTGHHCFVKKPSYNLDILNIQASRFLRSYNHSLSFLEPLKIYRIKSSMTYAAKNNKTFHLWWHPHNFSQNIFENINQLNEILTHYQYLNNKYNFQSQTMNEFSKNNI